MGEKEEKIFNYPALERCMIVESRFSRRQEIINSIKSTSLFDKIIEAQSLSDGVQKVRTLNFDVCFVGTSISIEKANDFLTQASQNSLAKDCSFVVVANEENQEQANNLNVAHGVLSWPSSRAKFQKGIVKSVVKANQNSPWTNLLEKYELEEAALELEHKKEQIREIITSSAEELRKISSNIQAKKYGLDQAGKIDNGLRSDIAKIIEALISKFNNHNEISNFKETFEKALSNWAENQIKLSPLEAKKLLQQDLLKLKL